MEKFNENIQTKTNCVQTTAKQKKKRKKQKPEVGHEFINRLAHCFRFS